MYAMKRKASRQKIVVDFDIICPEISQVVELLKLEFFRRYHHGANCFYRDCSLSLFIFNLNLCEMAEKEEQKKRIRQQERAFGEKEWIGFNKKTARIAEIFVKHIINNLYVFMKYTEISTVCLIHYL